MEREGVADQEASSQSIRAEQSLAKRCPEQAFGATASEIDRGHRQREHRGDLRGLFPAALSVPTALRDRAHNHSLSGLRHHRLPFGLRYQHAVDRDACGHPARRPAQLAQVVADRAPCRKIAIRPPLVRKRRTGDHSELAGCLGIPQLDGVGHRAHRNRSPCSVILKQVQSMARSAVVGWPCSLVVIACAKS